MWCEIVIFLVFHIWLSIVMVNVRTNFLVFNGSDKVKMLIYVAMEYIIFFVRLIIFLRVIPDCFISFAVNVKMIFIFCLYA